MMPTRTVSSEYEEADYLQFTAGPGVRIAMRAIGILFWPLVLPLALLSRVSDVVFRTCSEFFALVPYFPGVMIRYEFYRFSLTGCGSNVLVESGAVFIYRDIEIGSNVLIGRQSIIHHCDIGDYVLIGERCTLLSGSRQHRYGDLAVPMALQGGEKRRIALASDCWIGSHAVVMDDVAGGAIVAAGAVVTKPVAARTIVAGIPAKVVGHRDPQQAERPSVS